jgi:hypothetical protein
MWVAGCGTRALPWYAGVLHCGRRNMFVLHGRNGALRNLIPSRPCAPRAVANILVLGRRWRPRRQS